MSTLNFSALARKIRLTKTAFKYNPEEEVLHLRAEVKFLKGILHMKQADSGGISQILYTMKKLKEENESLKKKSMNQDDFSELTHQNSLLREKLKTFHPTSTNLFTLSTTKLPYLNIQNRRGSFLQRTSSSSKLASKSEPKEINLQEYNPQNNFEDGGISPTRISFKKSLGELPSLNSPLFEVSKKHSRTEISVLDDTIGFSEPSKVKSFRIETPTDRKSKFGLHQKEGLPSIKVDRSLGEKSFKNLIIDTKLGASKSEKSTSNKYTFSEYMKDQMTNQLLRKKYSRGIPINQKRSSVTKSTSLQRMSKSFKEGSFVEQNDITVIKTKLDSIHSRLIKLDINETSLIIQHSKDPVQQPKLVDNYLKNLEGIKRQMRQFNFS